MSVSHTAAADLSKPSPSSYGVSFGNLALLQPPEFPSAPGDLGMLGRWVVSLADKHLCGLRWCARWRTFLVFLCSPGLWGAMPVAHYSIHYQHPLPGVSSEGSPPVLRGVRPSPAPPT